MAEAGQRKRDNRDRLLEKVVPLLRIGNRVKQTEELPLENAPAARTRCAQGRLSGQEQRSQLDSAKCLRHEYTTGTMALLGDGRTHGWEVLASSVGR